MHVLVIDHELEVARALKRLLEGAGARTAVLDDPAGLDAMLEGATFGAVICALIMPGVSGFEVLARVKQKLPAARRFLLTASPHLLTAEQLAPLGDVVVFDKPWDDAVVLSALGL